jgi:hypothetical protein
LRRGDADQHVVFTTRIRGSNGTSAPDPNVLLV